MSTSIELKKQAVSEVASKFKESVSCVVVDSRGLTVQQATELRRQLRKEGIEFKVIKNNISRRAALEAGFKDLEEVFIGPSAIAFSKEDAVAPAKVLFEFAKKHKKLEIKGGFIEQKVVEVDQINEIAKLPGREGLLSMLLSVLQAPIRNFAYAVKSVAELDQNATETNE